MKRTLYLLSGLPGSGKSTWAVKQVEASEPGTAKWISRDATRFLLLDENDNYFAHEDKVFKIFIMLINDAIQDSTIQTIIADATHLNDRSREKTLSQLNFLSSLEVVNVIFDVPFEVCLERNAQRTGRAFVPEKVIKRMNYGFKMPNNGYKTIIINEKGEIRNV